MRKPLVRFLTFITMLPAALTALTVDSPPELLNEFPRLDKPTQFIQAEYSGKDCLVFQGVNTVVAEATTKLPQGSDATATIDFMLSQGANSIGITLNGGFEETAPSAVALVNTYPNAAPRLTLYFGEKFSAKLPENVITMRNLELDYRAWHRLTLQVKNGEIHAWITREDASSSAAPLLELSLPDAPIENWRPVGVALRFYRSPQSEGQDDTVAIKEVSFQ